MGEAIVIRHSLSQIGYVARTTTQGEESKMVEQYIDFLVNKYNGLQKKSAVIFIEPQIESGYPDIVVVEFFPNHDMSVNWNVNRSKLTHSDMKILFHICISKHSSVSTIRDMLGFTESDIIKSLTRLAEFGLIRLSKTKRSVQNVSVQRFCSVCKIISIEAKIDKWSKAIRQAEQNIWFSTESYILMNKCNCTQSIMQVCKERGIGILLINGRMQRALPSERRTFPVSYGSILFHEWIQRYLHMERSSS